MLQQTNAQYQQANRQLESKSLNVVEFSLSFRGYKCFNLFIYLHFNLVFLSFFPIVQFPYMEESLILNILVTIFHFSSISSTFIQFYFDQHVNCTYFNLPVAVSRDEVSRQLRVVQDHWAQLQNNKKK